jgi:3-oxoacyl-[acyl-carrier protein] reductase
MTDLSGKVAVVTGASRGIGQAVAVRLGRLGASVVVNYSRDASGAAATVAEIKAADSRAIDVRADVSKPTEIETLLDPARSQFGSLDIVVANAGLDEGLGPVLDVTEAEYDRMFSVNTKGAFFTLQKAARMVDSGGSIVYIGSSSTLQPHAPAPRRIRPLLVEQTAAEFPGRGARPGNRRTRRHGQRRPPDGAGYFTAGNDDSQLRSIVQNASPIGSSPSAASRKRAWKVARMGTVDDVAGLRPLPVRSEHRRIQHQLFGHPGHRGGRRRADLVRDEPQPRQTRQLDSKPQPI